MPGGPGDRLKISSLIYTDEDLMRISRTLIGTLEDLEDKRESAETKEIIQAVLSKPLVIEGLEAKRKTGRLYF